MTTGLDPQELHRLLTEAADVLHPIPPRLAHLGRQRARRRLQRLAATTGAVGAAAAAVAVVVVSSGGLEHLRPPVQPANGTSTSTASAPPASASPSPSSTIALGAEVDFGAMTVTLPEGWTVMRRESVPAGVDHMGATPQPYGAGEWMCVVPGGDHGPTLFGSAGCNGLKFERGVVFGAANTLFVAHQPNGWYTASDAQQCLPAHPSSPASSFDAVRATGQPIRTGFAPVGGRSAVFDEWSAHCDSGFSFTPRSWYLPQSLYRILDLYNNPETAWILQHISYH